MRTVKNPKVKTLHRYDWKSLTNGEWWELKLGEDIQVPLRSFRCTAAVHAKRNGMKVTIRQAEQDGVVLIRFFKAQEETKNRKVKAKSK